MAPAPTYNALRPEAKFDRNSTAKIDRSRIAFVLTLPLILAISIPTVLVLAGLCILYFRFRKMEDRLQQMDHDIHQFYRDLGRPKADIITFPFRGRNRPS
jgi:hypothetical protein